MLFFALVLASSSPWNSPQKSTDNVIFSAPLIHRSSPGSPFFDPNYSHHTHIEEGVNTSLARAHYFSQSKASSSKVGHVSAPLSGWILLMKYSIGTPPFETYGIFDTGSSFTWIQCYPCTQCIINQGYPLFDPRHSSSYQKLSCFDTRCRMGPSASCASSSVTGPRLCKYYTGYLDNTTSKGIVSTETVSLSAEHTSATVKNVVFGCGNDNDDAGTGLYLGVVGLGRGEGSLLHQLSVSHFSYYVVANGKTIQGYVHFGPGSSLSDFGMTTPILSNDKHLYYLNLTGISVDGSDLDLPAGIFEADVGSDGNHLGFVIDSGTTFTSLRSEAFDALKIAIMEAMYEYTPESSQFFELCYKDISSAPEVVFQFTGLDYMLCNANLWMKQSGLYCLAMLRMKESVGKLSILGFYQQRNVQVGYDLENNLLSLVYPGACPDDATEFVPN